MAVKFEIYRDGQQVREFKIDGVVVVGAESVIIPGKITFTNGVLSAQRTEDSAIGISLLWDAGDIGMFCLETTRLSHRAQPYILNVELARFRLMKIMQKYEDWNLFDFPGLEDHFRAFNQAQALFAEALANLHQPAEAARLADQALAMAIDLSEKLALTHSELLIRQRRTRGQFVRHIFGCQIDPGIQNERYREILGKNFDYAVVPMPWRDIQPQADRFETTAADGWLENLRRLRMPVIAGPLVRLDDNSVPDWMVLYEEDYEAFRELVYSYVTRVAKRYHRIVSIWNVAAGLSANRTFRLNFDQMIELTRMLVTQIKNVLPEARTLVTIAHPFGEYHAERAHTVAPLLYADMVSQTGINFEAFGLEIEMGVPQTGYFTRDLFQLSCLLDKFNTLGRPVFLTAVCVPGRNNADPGDRSRGQLDPQLAGRWHRQWDPALQAEWMEAVYQLALSKPCVESIAWSNLADIHQSMPAGGLLDDLLQPKPAFVRLQEMRKNFATYTSNRRANV
ncbi:MAG: hypothetical protein IT448_02975 [Phycisphaerales bacterium]|nr:hypothetical protein [Phycisphaerales bacterium]